MNPIDVSAGLPGVCQGRVPRTELPGCISEHHEIDWWGKHPAKYLHAIDLRTGHADAFKIVGELLYIPRPRRATKIFGFLHTYSHKWEGIQRPWRAKHSPSQGETVSGLSIHFKAEHDHMLEKQFREICEPVEWTCSSITTYLEHGSAVWLHNWSSSGKIEKTEKEEAILIFAYKRTSYSLIRRSWSSNHCKHG